MGKSLKGKELGVGISQRKDGLYTARYTTKGGERKQAYFHKLQECRNWLADRQFEEEHGNVLFSENPTVDAWFEYWMDEIKGDNIRYHTRKDYAERYRSNIKPLIGDMLIKDVKPLHCQNVLVQMSDRYKNSTIDKARIVMHSMFASAAENEILSRNPVTKSVKCASGKKSKDARVLTVEEQKMFFEAAKGNSNYNQWAFLLQTGLRTGEMIGLQWGDVDFKNHVVHVRRTMEYRYESGEWMRSPPKTANSVRDVPLTKEALRILKDQKNKNSLAKVPPMEFSDVVFVGKDGRPRTNNAYNRGLYRACDKAGIERFSMHALRHTYATRCIEAGMRPKTVQMLLGHSSLSITMDLYVHVTDDEKFKEMAIAERRLKLV